MEKHKKRKIIYFVSITLVLIIALLLILLFSLKKEKDKNEYYQTLNTYVQERLETSVQPNEKLEEILSFNFEYNVMEVSAKTTNYITYIKTTFNESHYLTFKELFNELESRERFDNLTNINLQYRFETQTSNSDVETVINNIGATKTKYAYSENYLFITFEKDGNYYSSSLVNQEGSNTVINTATFNDNEINIQILKSILQ